MCLYACACVCVFVCVFLCAGSSHSSNEIKDDQVNHLLTGLQHHMEVNRPPLVSVDKRYHIAACSVWCSEFGCVEV